MPGVREWVGRETWEMWKILEPSEGWTRNLPHFGEKTRTTSDVQYNHDSLANTTCLCWMLFGLTAGSGLDWTIMLSTTLFGTPRESAMFTTVCCYRKDVGVRDCMVVDIVASDHIGFGELLRTVRAWKHVSDRVTLHGALILTFHAERLSVGEPRCTFARGPIIKRSPDLLIDFGNREGAKDGSTPGHSVLS